MIAKLCNSNQLPSPGCMKAFTGRDGLNICVAKLQGGELTAFENRCPHQNAPLSAGTLEGGKVACPYHGWRFDALSGAGECEGDEPLTMYEIRQYGDEVFARLPD